MAIAHRGASEYAPENTLVSFDLALRMGARHFELDVQETRDGQLAVIHDDTVDRTTNGKGKVSEFSLSELQALDAGSCFGEEFAGARIPTLEEVCLRYRGKVHLHVEIKGKGTRVTGLVAELVRRLEMEKQVTITSFQRERLVEMRRLAPELPCGWLVVEVDDAVIERAQVLGLAQICPKATAVRPELVVRLHSLGFVVRAWGVGTEEAMRKVVEAGADGMTVNFPDKLLAYLATR
jgi:glycerophosphoryl diester phosphodiesterase